MVKKSAQQRLTFYIDRDSLVHNLNPLTKLTAAFTFIILAFFGPGYWLPTGLILLAIIPSSFAAKVGKEFSQAAASLLLPVAWFLFVMQSFFYPEGQTVLLEVWFLDVTSEGIRAGYLIVSRIMAMVSSFLLLLLTTHPSTLMGDLTNRGLPGAFAYVITSTLQIIPQMRLKANKIIEAQSSRGLETTGTLLARIKALVPLVRPLVFGSLVDVEERTIAIEARAFTSPTEKVPLIEIPDRKAEKVVRWIFLALMLSAVGSRVWLSLISKN
jgi:energy-coupling factor transport system permease protein